MQEKTYKVGFYTVACMLINALNMLTIEQVDKLFENFFVIDWLRNYTDLQEEFLQLCKEEFAEEDVEKVTNFLKNPL